MERPVTFLQFLLVLVMAIQVIYSCDCEVPRTMEDSICAGEALFMATPLSVKKVGGKGNYVDDLKLTLFFKYELFMNTLYHNGPDDLIHNHNVTVFSPIYCHVDLEPKHEYYIAGLKHEETSLVITSCDYVERVEWRVHDDAHELKNDFLTRQSAVTCNKKEN